MTDPYWAYTYVYYPFKEKIRERNYCGHNIFIEGMFVPQLSSNAGISV